MPWAVRSSSARRVAVQGRGSRTARRLPWWSRRRVRQEVGQQRPGVIAGMESSDALRHQAATSVAPSAPIASQRVVEPEQDQRQGARAPRPPGSARSPGCRRRAPSAERHRTARVETDRSRSTVAASGGTLSRLAGAAARTRRTASPSSSRSAASWPTWAMARRTCASASTGGRRYRTNRSPMRPTTAVRRWPACSPPPAPPCRTTIACGRRRSRRAASRRRRTPRGARPGRRRARRGSWTGWTRSPSARGCRSRRSPGAGPPLEPFARSLPGVPESSDASVSVAAG